MCIHEAAPQGDGAPELTSEMISAGREVLIRHVGDEPRVFEPEEIVEKILKAALMASIEEH